MSKHIGGSGNTKVVTVVLEIEENQTVEKLYELFKDSVWTHGCRVRNIVDGDIPELLDECSQNYADLLSESEEII